MRAYLRKQAFTLWLLAAVGLAIIWPDAAAKGGILRAEFTTQVGVWIIFFMQGLSLPTSELVVGYRPKRLHVFILSWNFLWYPLVTGVVLLPLSIFLPDSMRLGFWLLAILPTTVAASIAFTAISGGSTSSAIFSSVLSNMSAVFIVPLVAVAYLATEMSVSIPVGPLFLKLAWLIIVPLILGQIVRALAAGKAAAVSRAARPVSAGIILFIVHAAFADSVASGFLGELPVGSLVAVVVGAISLLGVASVLIWYSLGLIRVEPRFRIAGFFCASHKSLATGLPLAASILAVAPDAVDPAAVLIPLMCFHPLQLLLAGWVSGRFGAHSDGQART